MAPCHVLGLLPLACAIAALWARGWGAKDVSPAPSHGTWSTVTVGGRTSDVFVPACARAGSPLILSLHAWAYTAAGQAAEDRFSDDVYNAPECPVIVYPQGKLRVSAAPFGGFSWNAGGCCPQDNSEHVDDTEFLSRVITETVKTFSVVSEESVFVVGVSNGGMMANRLACTDARIKAMVSVAGPLINGSHTAGRDLDTFACSRRVPLLHFHGNNDPIIPFEGCSATHGPHACQTLLMILGTSIADSLQPVPDYIRDWRVRNGQLMEQHANVTFRNGTTNCTSWGDTASNVTLCIVDGQGHAWPGRCTMLNKLVPGCSCSHSIDASHHAMAFLRRYFRPTSVVV